MKPIFKPQTEWLPPESFPDLSKYSEIAIDLETKDPDLKTIGSGSVVGRSKIVGIAVAVQDWKGYYPIAHEGGGNMDIRMVLKWFQDVLNTDAIKIFHNAMYDVCFIKAAGLKINRRKRMPIQSKKRNINRCSNMGCTFNRESFSKTEPTI
jgi:hypothetical protein